MRACSGVGVVISVIFIWCEHDTVSCKYLWVS